MSSIAVLTIGSVAINNFDGLYSLNSLHEASGGEKKHQPAFFMRNKEVSELATEIQHSANLKSEQVVKRVNGGKNRGTYVCKELVYRYAMWISPKFALIVIRAFDSLINPKTTADQRTPLRKACDSLAVGNMLISDAYKLVAKEFEVDNIEQIPSNRLAEAVAFAYETKLRLQKTSSSNLTEDEEIHVKKWHIVGSRANTMTRDALAKMEDALCEMQRTVEHAKKCNSLGFDSFDQTLRVSAKHHKVALPKAQAILDKYTK